MNSERHYPHPPSAQSLALENLRKKASRRTPYDRPAGPQGDNANVPSGFGYIPQQTPPRTSFNTNRTSALKKSQQEMSAGPFDLSSTSGSIAGTSRNLWPATATSGRNELNPSVVGLLGLPLTSKGPRVSTPPRPKGAHGGPNVCKKPVKINNDSFVPTRIRTAPRPVLAPRRSSVTFEVPPKTDSEPQHVSSGAPRVPTFNSNEASFSGLILESRGDRHSDMLLTKIESMYQHSRSQVYLKSNGRIITPLMFLKSIYRKMNIRLHTERFMLIMGGVTQVRAEVFAGAFCGVGHAVTSGFARQLAAIQVLERMRSHNTALMEATLYGLMPGCRYTQAQRRLQALCQRYELGEVNYWVRDLWKGGVKLPGIPVARFECHCRVNTTHITGRSDDPYMGLNFVAAKMYSFFVPEPELYQEAPIMDTYGVGAECPQLKAIHPDLLNNVPSAPKRDWQTTFQVGESDGVLHDSLDQSRHLEMPEHRGYLAEFGPLLKEALEWHLTQFQIQNEHGTQAPGGAAAAQAVEMELDGGDEEEEDDGDEFFDALE